MPLHLGVHSPYGLNMTAPAAGQGLSDTIGHFLLQYQFFCIPTTHSYYLLAPLAQAQVPKDAVTVIVVRAPLLNQWSSEIRDFIEPGHIDIWQYNTATAGNITWWNETFASSPQIVACRKVLIVSTEVKSFPHLFSQYLMLNS